MGSDDSRHLSFIWMNRCCGFRSRAGFAKAISWPGSMVFHAHHGELNVTAGMAPLGRCSWYGDHRLMRIVAAQAHKPPLGGEFMTKISSPLSWPVLALLAGGAFALPTALPPVANAVDSPSPAPAPATQSAPAGKSGVKAVKKKKTTKEKKSEQQFIDGYKA